MSRPLRGEVWWVSLDPTVGREQAGRRPGLVVSVDGLNQSGADLVILLPITSRDKGLRSHVEIRAGEAGLAARSFAKCEDIRSVSVERLLGRQGRVAAATLAAVEERLRMLLGL